jgi:hypothetical protein
LVVDETGAYGEPPTAIHRIRVFLNPEEFVAGHGITLNDAILDLVDSVNKNHGIP